MMPKKWVVTFTRSAPLLMIEIHKKVFFSAVKKWLYSFTDWIRYENNKGSTTVFYPEDWEKVLSERISAATTKDVLAKIKNIIKNIRVRSKKLKECMKELKQKKVWGLKDFEHFFVLASAYNCAYLALFPMANVVYKEKPKLYAELREEIEITRNSPALFKDIEEMLLNFCKDEKRRALFLWLFKDEIKSHLTHNILPSEKVLRKRYEAYTMVVNITGKETFTTRAEKTKIDAYAVIKGMTTYGNGKITGAIVKVLHPEELKNVKKGDILVAHATSTWYFPALKKVRAIITDEGGVTSHAAIISRELKKPCIIGTKIATKVLKDGDIVEVDAEKGIVNILDSNPVFERAFSRDFSLAAIQLAAISESSDKKPWLLQPSPYKPHIVCERNDGTVHFYYHPKSWEWNNYQLIDNVKKDKQFLKKVEKNVLKEIEPIRQIYESERTLSLKQLKEFINNLISAYPWVEAMWLLYRLTPKELGADNSNIKKLRVLTDKLSSGTDVVIRKSLVRAYPKLGNLSSMISLKEIQTGKIPFIEELKKRDAGYYVVDDQLHIDLSHGALENKFKIQLEHITVEKVTEIKGQIAQKGKVRGVVCRVMGHNDFGKIKEGQILVSPMTMPDFLSEMKKASAFVTDEGGIMCHAAIVARELKKPCIIGTKIATKVLKDGDLVEVDANKGVVRKIK